MTPVHNNELMSILHEAIDIAVFVGFASLAFTPSYECWNSKDAILRPFQNLTFFPTFFQLAELDWGFFCVLWDVRFIWDLK